MHYPRVSVFCASSVTLDPIYYDEAKDLGQSIAAAGHELVYGAGEVGLMGAVALTAKSHGGKVIGVCPKDLHEKGFTWSGCDELILTEGLRDRKQVMDDLSDAFVVLPGGFGTFDEMIECLANKQLHYHEKPVILLNTQGFFNTFLNLIEELISGRFARPVCRDMLQCAEDVEEVMELLAHPPADPLPGVYYNLPEDKA